MAIRLIFILGLVAIGAALWADREPLDTCQVRASFSTCFASLNR